MVIELAIQGLNSLANPFLQPIFVNILFWTLSSIATILSFWTKADRNQDQNELSNNLELKTYDFIVVGAGSAGAVVANRLSRTHNVLLLEAGGDLNPLQYIPGFGLFLLNFPETDWMHRTVPQKYASLNSVSQQSSWSTGLGLGGTGSINLMIHLRGHKKDFDNWANITGDPSWNWEGVLPYFKSYENYEDTGDEVNHGYRGELNIQAPDHIGVAPEFVRAGVEMGYPNVDLNAPFSEGFDIIRYPIRNGERIATYKAFLEPIRTRKTLTILKYSHVNKILFRDGNVAYGVQFDRHGKSLSAYASKEIIISGGSVNTPKILMLSGVGPRDHLEEFNIPVVSDLPVGQNLQDHIGIFLSPFFLSQPRATYLERDVTMSAFVKWFTQGRGPLSSTGCEGTGLISSEFAKSRGEWDWPDIHYFLFSFTIFRNAPAYLSRSFGLKLDEIEKYYTNAYGVDASHLMISGARPFARGYIKLGGSSSYDKPVIDPNYLGDAGETDLNVLLEATKTAMVLIENTTAFGGALGVRFTDVKLPGCEHLEFRSDAYWICYIRRFSITLHHPVGTASMGSVVDTQLRVIGTKNLRVMDASVQPVIVSTNTQASTIMIAEKGSNMLIQDWKVTEQQPLGKKQGIFKKKLNKLIG